MRKLLYLMMLAALAAPITAQAEDLPPGWITGPDVPSVIGLNQPNGSAPSTLVPQPDVAITAVSPGCSVQAVAWKVTTRGGRHTMRLTPHGVHFCGPATAAFRRSEYIRLTHIGEPVYVNFAGCEFVTPAKGKGARSGIHYCSN